MINSQLQKLDSNAMPSLEQIENADLTIWDESWSKVSLKPNAQSGLSPPNTHFWRTLEGETLWQGLVIIVVPSIRDHCFETKCDGSYEK